MHIKSISESTNPFFAFAFFRGYFSASIRENRVFPFRQGDFLANEPNDNAKCRHGWYDSYTSDEDQPCKSEIAITPPLIIISSWTMKRLSVMINEFCCRKTL